MVIAARPAPRTAPSAAPRPAKLAWYQSTDGRLFGLLLVGYPLAWMVGFGPMIFAAAAFVMCLWLLYNRPLKVPAGTLLYAIFLLMAAASIIQVDGAGRLALYVVRFSWYLSAFVALLYLARQSGHRARRLVVRSLVALMAIMIAWGYVALVAPTLAWQSPVGKVLPGFIANDPFVSDLVNPRAAEIQHFRWQNVTLNRPAAPFAYTNAWGSTFALLFPFLLAAYSDRRIGVPRPVALALMAAGMVPFYYALNRGAWLTLAGGIAYGTISIAVRDRNSLPLKLLALLAAVALPLAALSGVFDTATAQLETRSADSNETRLTLYSETLSASVDSPWIGFGSPRTNPANPTGPPLGTHGQLWAILYAHGWVAVGAYFLYFVQAFLLSRGQGATATWARVCLAIGLVQSFFYGHIPMQLFILVAASVMAAWPDWPPTSGPPARRLVAPER